MSQTSSPYWEIDPESLAHFNQGLKNPPSGPSWARLRRAAEELALLPAFDRLITLDMNRIDELPHQIKVALQALRDPMHGRAILADEVGLGKTIEAGIILKELWVRGLVRRVLILTPASLVTQWVEELDQKFLERFEPIEDPGQWSRATRAIASYDRARTSKHAEQLLRHKWDLLIVDEAHKCKNHNTARYKLLQKIERNYLLLLTATPIQNDLRELYNLVTLLRPGHLGTWREFKREFVPNGNIREVRQAAALREMTARVMIRTRRASVAHIMSLPPRRVLHPELTLSAAEATIYRAVSKFLRDLYRDGFRVPSDEEERADRRRKCARTGRGIFLLECLRVAQRLCSSAPALASSMFKLGQGELVIPSYRKQAFELAEQAGLVTTHAKLDKLTSLLEDSKDRVVVFSEHLPTIKLIVRRAAEVGRVAIPFTGQLSRSDRQRALVRFRSEPTGILVSTRAGSEGLNLQFCHQLVNYELPWNPMVVEQRIGRVHRYGQQKEVLLHNYAAKGTVEAHILRLLHTKIRLFELVVGELDLILERMGDDAGDSFASLLGDLWLQAESDEEFEHKIEALGDQVVKERTAALAEEKKSSDVSALDAAGRLQSEFAALSVPARLRLGYGTVLMNLAPGVEAMRSELGISVSDTLEMLGMGPVIESAGLHNDYGPLYRLTGLTGRGRAVSILAQADRLPLTLVKIEADAEVALPV